MARDGQKVRLGRDRAGNTGGTRFDWHRRRRHGLHWEGLRAPGRRDHREFGTMKNGNSTSRPRVTGHQRSGRATGALREYRIRGACRGKGYCKEGSSGQRAPNREPMRAEANRARACVLALSFFNSHRLDEAVRQGLPRKSGADRLHLTCGTGQRGSGHVGHKHRLGEAFWAPGRAQPSPRRLQKTAPNLWELKKLSWHPRNNANGLGKTI